MLDESTIIMYFTSWHDWANKTAGSCNRLQTLIVDARKVSKENKPKAEELFRFAKEVCSNVTKMAELMEENDQELPEKQRESRDLAQVLVNDGLAGLTEVLNNLVGAKDGLASFMSLWTAALSLGPGVCRGTLRAKSIVPEASLPGALIVMLPWIYAPLAWSLCNTIVQIFGDWALLLAASSVAFYPVVMSLVGMCFFVGSPQRHTDVSDMMRILKRVEKIAIFLTAALALLWVYQAYAAIYAAKDEHPILKYTLDFVTKESREALDDGKKWAKDHLLHHFDLPRWISRNAFFAMRCLVNTLTPFISFYMQFILTSMVSTDWVLREISRERRANFLAANRDNLGYDASNEDIEQLRKSRIARLDALVIAFGGTVEDQERRNHARK